MTRDRVGLGGWQVGFLGTDWNPGGTHKSWVGKRLWLGYCWLGVLLETEVLSHSVAEGEEGWL